MRPDPPRRFEAYIRSLTPTKNNQIGSLLDRIEQLEADGVVDSTRVYVVGDAVCPEIALKTDHGRHLCARMLQFRDWAKQNGKRFGPFFEPQRATCEFTGSEFRTISLPEFTLAEFVDDTLEYVTPCMDDERYVTPKDRLEKHSTSVSSKQSSTAR